MRAVVAVGLALSLMVPVCEGGSPYETEGVAKSWIGKSRAEVIEKWGDPVQVKRTRAGGELLLFELLVPAGRFQYGPDAADSFEYAVEKNDEGKKKLVLKDNSVLEPVYKKVKIKFHLDGNGCVTRVDIPKKAGMYAIPAPGKVDHEPS